MISLFLFINETLKFNRPLTQSARASNSLTSKSAATELHLLVLQETFFSPLSQLRFTSGMELQGCDASSSLTLILATSKAKNSTSSDCVVLEGRIFVFFCFSAIT